MRSSEKLNNSKVLRSRRTKHFDTIKRLVICLLLLIIGVSLVPLVAFADEIGVILVGDSRTEGMKSAFTETNVFYVCETGKTWEWYKSDGHGKVKEVISGNSSIKKWKVIYNLGVNDLAGASASDLVPKIKEYLPDLLKELKDAELYYAYVLPINESVYKPYREKQLNGASGHIMTNADIKTFNAEMAKVYEWTGTVDLSSEIKDDMIKTADGDMGIHYSTDIYKTLASKYVEKAKGGESDEKEQEEKDVDKAVKDVLNSYQTSEDDLNGMDKKPDWGKDTPELPDGSDLTQEESMQLNKWKADVKDNNDLGIIKTVRAVIAFFGILVIIYALVLYLAYWLDRLNNFVEIAFLTLLTFGRLAVSPDEIESTFNSGNRGLKIVTHTDMLKIVIITLIAGVFLASGQVYRILSVLINILESIVAYF